MRRRQSEGCLSDLQFDRWLARELAESEQPKLEAHLARCASCRQRRAELDNDRRHFTQTAPELGSSKHPDVSASRQRGRWVAGAGALAAAAAVALLVSRTEPSVSPRVDAASDGIRTKGGIASLGWIVRRGSHVFAGHPDQRLRPGDALRFTVSAREPVYVAVLGLDAVGHSSVYHPEGDHLWKLGAGQDQPLPGAIELDSTPGEERLYAVFCKADVPLVAVTSAIERSSEAPLLPNGCVHEHWSLKKESP